MASDGPSLEEFLVWSRPIVLDVPETSTDCAVANITSSSFQDVGVTAGACQNFMIQMCLHASVVSSLLPARKVQLFYGSRHHNEECGRTSLQEQAASGFCRKQPNSRSKQAKGLTVCSDMVANVHTRSAVLDSHPKTTNH